MHLARHFRTCVDPPVEFTPNRVRFLGDFLTDMPTFRIVVPPSMLNKHVEDSSVRVFAATRPSVATYRVTPPNQACELAQVVVEEALIGQFDGKDED